MTSFLIVPVLTLYFLATRLHAERLGIDHSISGAVDSVIATDGPDADAAPPLALPRFSPKPVQHSRDLVIAVARRHAAHDFDVFECRLLFCTGRWHFDFKRCICSTLPMDDQVQSPR